MSDLDDFLHWGAHFGMNARERDSFGRLVDHNYPKFPYGEISFWIAEYKFQKQAHRG